MRDNLPALAAPMGWIYGAGMRLREWFYASGALPQHAAGVPVLCIGNLTLGGTGKTPVVRQVVRGLVSRGRKPGIISRGYGRTGPLGQFVLVSDGHEVLVSADVAGDEPYLLARSLGVPVAVCSDRVRAAHELVTRCACDCIVMDDGFQHLRLKRNADIVLIDSTAHLARLRIFPAGPLREGIEALHRATAVLHTRVENGRFLAENQSTVSTVAPHLPQFTAEFQLAPTLCSLRGLLVCTNMDAIISKRAAAFAGVAKPEIFFEQLRRAGITLSETRALPDHVEYTEALVRSLDTMGDLLLTTEKDAVKLEQFTPAKQVLVVMQSVTIPDEPNLFALLEEKMQRPNPE